MIRFGREVASGNGVESSGYAWLHSPPDGVYDLAALPARNVPCSPQSTSQSGPPYRALSHAIWGVRNAGTLLFAALCQRALRHRRTREEVVETTGGGGGAESDAAVTELLGRCYAERGRRLEAEGRASALAHSAGW